MDGRYNDEKWEALKKHVGGKAGAELVDALKDIYTIYDESMIDWYAGLYDPKIGGYYYSNSARDNEEREFEGRMVRLLPDIESTFQAINFWCSGLDGGIKEWGRWMPKWQQEKIAEFVYNLQDEDGFFYHPQWGKDIPLSRRARDFNWATHIVEHLKGSLKYKTFRDIPSSDKEETKTVLVPEHMKSSDAFREYLDSLNVSCRSYHAGNELCSQSGQMSVFGRLEECYDYLIERLNENGHWHSENNYYAINGLFKTSFIFNATNRPHPRALQAARATIDAISSDEPMSAITDLYNTWYTIRNIIDNQKRFGGEEAEKTVATIQREIWEIAPSAIRVSKKKLLKFKRADSGFSYGPEHSAPNSQGAPVAIPGTAEGDMNATNIALGTTGNIFLALGLSDFSVPIFNPAKRDYYIGLLDEKRKNASQT